MVEAANSEDNQQEQQQEVIRPHNPRPGNNGSSILNLAPIQKAQATGLFREAELNTHVDVVYGQYVQECERIANEEEDFVKTEFAENMETAGFREPLQRAAMGGVYNHVTMFNMLGPATDNSENKPLGNVSVYQKFLRDYITLFCLFVQAWYINQPVFYGL